MREAGTNTGEHRLHDARQLARSGFRLYSISMRSPGCYGRQRRQGQLDPKAIFEPTRRSIPVRYPPVFFGRDGRGRYLNTASAFFFCASDMEA